MRSNSKDLLSIFFKTNSIIDGRWKWATRIQKSLHPKFIRHGRSGISYLMLVICKTNGPKYLYLAYAWKPITDWLESISTAQWRHRFNIKSKPDLSAFWSKLDDFFSRNNCNILRLRKKNLKIVLIYTNSNQGTLVI